MPRNFNIAGPCKPELHYMLPPLRRLPDLAQIVAAEEYFVLHAPRQTGKTTAILALAKQLTESGNYAAVMLSVETGSMFADAAASQSAIRSAWRSVLPNRLPPDLRPPESLLHADAGEIGPLLAGWSRACPRPVVLFVDEIDSLTGEALLSVLRQLRSGFSDRPRGFPACVALVGMRDVRDYKTEGQPLGSASPFNIKVASFTLGNFSLADVGELYAQHTEDTGQVFEPSAIEMAFSLSGGQPWLVNALARECARVLVPDPREAITDQHMFSASRALIERQDTHLDSLAERLREPRVRGLIEPMLAGENLGDVHSEDRQFILDLGLVVADAGGGLRIANPIYAQIVPRMLTGSIRASLAHVGPAWIGADGMLAPDRLLASFLDFWRQHGEQLHRAAPYSEAAAQLVMLAFLDRVANGGGRVDKEYAIGRGRIDLCLHWRGQRFAFELKTWRAGQRNPIEAGLAQLDDYLAGLSLSTGWLVVFDQRPGQPPIYERTEAATTTTPAGRTITLLMA